MCDRKTDQQPSCTPQRKFNDETTDRLNQNINYITDACFKNNNIQIKQIGKPLFYVNKNSSFLMLLNKTMKAFAEKKFFFSCL